LPSIGTSMIAPSAASLRLRSSSPIAVSETAMNCPYSPRPYGSRRSISQTGPMMLGKHYADGQGTRRPLAGAVG
jgi:hypothetical protein